MISINDAKPTKIRTKEELRNLFLQDIIFQMESDPPPLHSIFIGAQSTRLEHKLRFLMSSSSLFKDFSSFSSILEEQKKGCRLMRWAEQKKKEVRKCGLSGSKHKFCFIKRLGCRFRIRGIVKLNQKRYVVGQILEFQQCYSGDKPSGAPLTRFLFKILRFSIVVIQLADASLARFEVIPC